ncbi:MAG: hypothetical protein WA373_08715 [Burkholderiales bacterium]
MDVLAEAALRPDNWRGDARGLLHDHRVRGDEGDVAEVDLAQPLGSARHRGGDEIELALLQQGNALGARERHHLQRHAHAPGGEAFDFSAKS